jgi:hypothetical protein
MRSTEPSDLIFSIYKTIRCNAEALSNLSDIMDVPLPIHASNDAKFEIYGLIILSNRICLKRLLLIDYLSKKTPSSDAECALTHETHLRYLWVEGVSSRNFRRSTVINTSEGRCGQILRGCWSRRSSWEERRQPPCQPPCLPRHYPIHVSYP